jgi:hypothetical protein
MLPYKRLKTAAEAEGAHLPVFLASQNLKRFISNDLEDGPLQPIVYKTGSAIVTGYAAEALPEICNVWLRAREAGALNRQQADRAQAAEILVRGLAEVGIIALVDEATGYQDTRDHLEFKF